MHFWKIIAKKAENEVGQVKFFLTSPPGQTRWVYILENEHTKETIAASATSELKIGTKIHVEDIKPIS
jgi:hypothetical protein